MSDTLTRTLKAISDPTRRDIFHVLLASEEAVAITQISDRFDMSRQGVTKHLSVLNQAGLVSIDVKGRHRYCQADATALQEVNEWVQKYEIFWDNKLGDLKSFLEKKKKSKKS